MEIVAQALGFAVFLFMLFLLGRMILGFIMSFSRDWRPQGVMLVVTEAVFSVTDPPIKLLRRVIPPVRMGHARLDIAFLVLFFGCSILYRVLFAIGQ